MGSDLPHESDEACKIGVREFLGCGTRRGEDAFEEAVGGLSQQYTPTVLRLNIEEARAITYVKLKAIVIRIVNFLTDLANNSGFPYEVIVPKGLWWTCHYPICVNSVSFIYQYAESSNKNFFAMYTMTNIIIIYIHCRKEFVEPSIQASC